MENGSDKGNTTSLGVTRSRTLLFLSYRSSAVRERSPWHTTGIAGETGNGSAIEAEGSSRSKQVRHGAFYDASGELHQHGAEAGPSYPPMSAVDDHRGTTYINSLPPRWVDVSDQVESLLASIQPKMAHLDRLHAKHILPGFTDRTGEEREIERETTEITKQFRKCSKLIAGLAQQTQALARTGRASAHEVSMANNVQTALATKVQEASGLFRRKQSNYMQRLRGHEERHHGLRSTGGTHEAGKATIPVEADSERAVQEDMELSRQHLARSQSHQTQQQQQQQQQLLIDEEQAAAPTQAQIEIAQRDREIDRIAKSIAELAELFQDLSALVIDQGTMLDRIDFNIEHIGQDMTAAVRELSHATRYQKRTSRGQCILFLVLLCILLLAFIIIKPFWR